MGVGPTSPGSSATAPAGPTVALSYFIPPAAQMPVLPTFAPSVQSSGTSDLRSLGACEPGRDLVKMQMQFRQAWGGA